MKAETNTLQTLFGTKRGVGNLAKFLIDTEAATRKWVLGDVDGERRKMFNKRVKTHDEVENKQEDQEMIILILIPENFDEIKTI
jgi:hypothetical protein